MEIKRLEKELAELSSLFKQTPFDEQSNTLLGAAEQQAHLRSQMEALARDIAKELAS